MTAALAVPESLAERYARATVAQRQEALKRLPKERQLELARGARPWWFWGRSDQFAPAGDWRWWLILAGRGWGKTRTGAEQSAQWAKRYPGSRGALVAPTFSDGRDTMVEGVSGLLSFTDFTQLRGGSIESGWNRSMGELFWANGSRAKVFSSEQPFRLRGPQHHWTWGDEPAYWRDVAAGTAKDSTFSNLNISLRLPPLPGWTGYRPRGVLTTTPRLVPLLKVSDAVLTAHPEMKGLMQRGDVAATYGATVANLRNLDAAYYEAVIAPLLGTTLGLQELGGILLEDVEGALWSQKLIEADRRPLPDPDALNRTVVAFDPAGGGGIGHDEHGIIIASNAGPRPTMHCYIREDRSGSMSVEHAAVEVIMAAWQYAADAIVFEKNQGQDWIPATIRSTYDAIRNATEESGPLLWAAHQVMPERWKLPTIEAVTAAKNKQQRATPVQQLYQQHRVHHVQILAVLESQMTTWVPGDSDSPDRLDAMVWAVLWLYGIAAGQATAASPAARERQGRRPGAPSSRLPQVYGARSGRRG